MSVSTHNQALSASLFVYRDMLGKKFALACRGAVPDPTQAHSIGLDER